VTGPPRKQSSSRFESDVTINVLIIMFGGSLFNYVIYV